jgi:hypothetical protein
VKKEDSFINLYKKIDATSKTRFNASRRLRLHSKFTTFTVVIISLGLILVSLMQAFDLGNNIESKLVGLMQVFSAVAVLVYSLLTDKNDYSNLSEKMYSCASQLGELKQKVHPDLDGAHDQAKYDVFLDDYHKVLKLYETHAINDFRGDYFRAKLEMPENYEVKGKEWWAAKAEIYFFHTLDFISYPIVLGVLGWFICWVWFGLPPIS